MSIGPNVPVVPGAVLGAADLAAQEDRTQRAEDGEPVGASDRDADIQRTRE